MSNHPCATKEHAEHLEQMKGNPNCLCNEVTLCSYCAAKPVTFTPFNTADYLTSEEDIAAYLEAAADDLQTENTRLREALRVIHLKASPGSAIETIASCALTNQPLPRIMSFT